MNWQSTVALFTAMVLLAALPSTSVWLVVGRSLSGGIKHGLATAAGIVASDLLLIAIAIGGLSLVATLLAPWHSLLRSLGGLYVISLGVQRFRTPAANTSGPTAPMTLLASSLLGFSLSLADQKAILFYFSFLPAFVETVTVGSVATTMATAIVAVGGVKAIYAFSAARLADRLPPQTQHRFQTLGGLMLVVLGTYVVVSGTVGN